MGVSQKDFSNMNLNQLIDRLEELRKKFGGNLPIEMDADVIGVFDEDGRDCEVRTGVNAGGEPSVIYIGG